MVELERNAPGGDARVRHGLRKSGNLRRRARALGQSKFSAFTFLRVRPRSPRSRRPRRQCLVPPPSLAAAVPRDVVRPSHGSVRFQRQGGDADTDAMAKEYDEKHIRVTRVQPNASLRSSRDTYRSSRRGEHGSGVVIWLADGAMGLLFIQWDVQMYMCVWVNSMSQTPPKNLRVRQSSSNRPHRHRRLAFGRTR